MMHQHKTNQWFCRGDSFLQAAMAVSATARDEPTRWLQHGGLDCKYVHLRIDMRTGDFIFLNNEGAKMTNEEILDMFPQLRPIVVYGEEEN